MLMGGTSHNVITPKQKTTVPGGGLREHASSLNNTTQQASATTPNQKVITSPAMAAINYATAKKTNTGQATTMHRNQMHPRNPHNKYRVSNDLSATGSRSQLE